jgi:hypothetical protein
MLEIRWQAVQVLFNKNQTLLSTAYAPSGRGFEILPGAPYISRACICCEPFFLCLATYWPYFFAGAGGVGAGPQRETINCFSALMLAGGKAWSLFTLATHSSYFFLSSS